MINTRVLLNNQYVKNISMHLNIINIFDPAFGAQSKCFKSPAILSFDVFNQLA